MSIGLMDRLAEAFFPSRCLACEVFCEAPGAAFCETCEIGLWQTRRPWCERCGRPLEGRPEDYRVCLGCAEDPPPFDRLMAAYFYGGPLADAVISFKHRGHAEYGGRLGKMMVAALASELPAVDLVVPVPLYPKRARQRGYNQAAILAEVAARAVRAQSREVLRRVIDTGSQRGRSRQERFEELSGAFEIGRKSDVAGRTILLVDDVVTTGATMRQCATTLRSRDARRIIALSLALVQ